MRSIRGAVAGGVAPIARTWQPVWLPAGSLLAALTVSALCVGKVAHANESGWTLKWRAPSACPNEQAVRQTVQAWLTQAIEPNDPSGIHVEATVVRKTDGFALDLSLETPSGGGHEQLTAAQCSTLAGVVALKVALAADPVAWFDALGSRVHTRKNYWLLRLGGGLALGVQPGAGPTFDLTGSRHFSGFALELGIGYALPNQVRYPGLRAGANLDLAYVDARICVLPNMETVEFPLCLGADVGLMRGVGFGPELVEIFASNRWYAALVVNPAVRWPVTRWLGVWLGIEALIAVSRPSFRVRYLEQLYVPEKIGARVRLGAEIRFE